MFDARDALARPVRRRHLRRHRQNAKRTAASVMREIRGDRDALGVAYARKPIRGTVLGVDIETTGRAPERGYIINVGWEIMELTSDAIRTTPGATTVRPADIYRGEDVPLSNIHHITERHRRQKAVPREQRNCRSSCSSS